MSTPRDLQLPACARAHVVTTARGDFAALEALPGPGVPVLATAVLVPGLVGSKEDFLAVLEPLAAAGIRVLAVDQRGQYETPGPDDPDAYDLAALGDDLLSLLGTADGSPVHLVGHSFGGLVVRAAAIADPAALATVTLMCSGPGPIEGAQAERARTLREAVAVFSPEQIWSMIVAQAETTGEHDGIAPEILDFLARRFTATAPAGLATMATQILETADRVDELAATGVPLLVAYGEDDFIWSPAEQAEMARRLGARNVVLRGAAHSPAVERPADTVDALLEFWADVGYRSAADG